MADAQLAQVVVHRHPGQGAEMLAQRALAALFLLAEFLQYKVFIQAARKPGDELIQQRFLRCGGGVISGVTMALQRHHQLGEKQLRQLVSNGVVLLALLLQLRNNLPYLSHAATA